MEVPADEAITGWGDCFAPSPVTLANKGIVERVIGPMIKGMGPFDRDVWWHKVYDLLRDHRQGLRDHRQGMPTQVLFGLGQALGAANGEIRAPTFRVMHEPRPLRGTSIAQRLLQGVEHERCMRRSAGPPSDNSASEGVDDEGDVDEAASSRDAEEVTAFH